MTIDVGTGSTFVLTSGGAVANILSMNIDGEEVPVTDFSNMATTGYRKKKPGDLKEPFQVTLELIFDPDDEPPASGTADTATITWPDTTTLAGTGFIVSRTMSTPLEDRMTANLVWQFDGYTGPTYTEATP